MKYVKRIFLVLCHAVLGFVVFLIAYAASSLYFSSLFDPLQKCPGNDTSVAVNSRGDQVRMRTQTCGSLVRVKSVLLYIRTAAGKEQHAFLSYTPDGTAPHIVWTSQNTVSVDLPTVHGIGWIEGAIGGTVINYGIKQVLP